MRIIFLLIFSACGSTPCPKVEQPRPVQINSSTPSCNLPSLPDPVTWGGVPEYDADGNETGWTLVTQDGLAELGDYLVAIAAWTQAARECLAAR